MEAAVAAPSLLDAPSSLESSKTVEGEELGAQEAWMQNVPLVYDMIMSFDLESAPAACCWGEDLPHTWRNNRYKYEKLLLAIDGKGDTNPQTGELQGSPSTLDVIHPRVPSLHVSDEYRMVGYLDTSKGGGLPYRKRILHPGSPLALRHCPLQGGIAATQGASSLDVFMWNTEHQPNRDLAHGVSCSAPDLFLRGHQAAPTQALAFHPTAPACCSGGSQGQVCVWNMEDSVYKRTAEEGEKSMYGESEAYYLKPRYELHAHEGAVTEVQFHPKEQCLLTSGVDGYVKLWDTRTQDPIGEIKADGSVTSASWNEVDEYTFLCGTTTGSILLFDRRNMSHSLLEPVPHRSAIHCVRWSPHHRNIYAVASDDMMALCDADLIRSQPSGTAEVPPEIIMIHCGHTLPVSFIDWHPRSPWMLSTVCKGSKEKGLPSNLQIWRPNEFLYMDKLDFKSLLKDYVSF